MTTIQGIYFSDDVYSIKEVLDNLYKRNKISDITTIITSLLFLKSMFFLFLKP